MLATPHDEDLFDYYATSQLAYLDSVTGKTSPLGKAGIFTMVRFSPDQSHLLVERLHKPYSYQLPSRLFPEDVEIWDRATDRRWSFAYPPPVSPF